MLSFHRPAYRFEIIRTSEGFADLRSRWESLLESGGYGIFSRWDWNLAWWQNFAKPRDKLALVWAERNGEPFGLAPFFVRRCEYYGLPLRLLKFLGEGNFDRGDVIVKAYDPTFYSELFGFLAEKVGWDVVYLREIPEKSGLLIWAGKSHIRSYFEKDSECPFVTFSKDTTPESSRQSLSRNIRKEFRKVARRLQKMGESRVCHRALTDGDDLLLRRLRDIEIASVKATRHIPLVFSPEDRFSFQKELIRQSDTSMQTIVSTLELNGKIIAYVYGFVMNNVYYAYNTAFLPEYTFLSPGKLLIQETIEHCIREGLCEFDFLRGNSYLKSKWTDRTRSQQHLTIFRGNLLDCFLGWLVFSLRPRVKARLHQWRSVKPAEGAE